MNYIGMDTDVVYAAGVSTAHLGPQADEIATAALRAYTTAAGVVAHPVLSAAFIAFADVHSTLHHSLAVQVKDGGSRLAKGSNAVSDGENDASHAHQQSAVSGEQQIQRNSMPLG